MARYKAVFPPKNWYEFGLCDLILYYAIGEKVYRNYLMFWSNADSKTFETQLKGCQNVITNGLQKTQCDLAKKLLTAYC